MNNLKQVREQSNLNQSELAKKVGCGRSYICEIENGTRNMTMDMAIRIAPFLHCEPSDLIGGDALKYDQSFIASCKSVLDKYFPIVYSSDEHLSNRDNSIYEIIDALVKRNLSSDQIETVHSVVMALAKSNLDSKK